MRIRERIREWLGITDLRAEVSMLDNSLMSLHCKTDETKRQISTITPGLVRIIAKLDAQYARDPQSADMIAESKAIEEQVFKRLAGEAAAREPYNNG